MARRTPAEVAAALDSRPARRAARLVARVIGHDGPPRIPHAIAWRLRERIGPAPPRIVIHGPESKRAASEHAAGRRVLLIGNDLSRSGAPQLLVEIARLLLDDGWSVTSVSPADGALRAELVDAGATVIVDPSIRAKGAPLLDALAGAVDVALCNTVDTAAAVDALASAVPLIWYIHEISLVEQLLAAGTGLDQLLSRPARLWTGSALAAAPLRAIRPDVEVVPYGLAPLAGVARVVAADRPLRLAVLASIEPRKGQDLLLDAIALLAPEVRNRVSVAMNGRTMFPDFQAAVRDRSAALPEVTLGDALDSEGYRAAMLGCDAVVIPSRDDTLPLVSLDALGAGRVLICTSTTGTAADLEHGVNGFVAAPTAAGIAAVLTEAMARADDWPAIATAGREVFDRTFSRAVFAARVRATLAAIARPAGAVS